ncbi:hypothetical protein [Sinorhizobium meliloti]|uniref:Deacetylase n=1 Tax=Rhizobium meliloti TaxID=382 RepID=A0A2J0YTW5_RHIML|nr:hypothetical protein [Sinorhizobium meliloti]PJR09838.1 hypothetical protein CEJ86_30485 [Sinorhizobium meliloti]
MKELLVVVTMDCEPPNRAALPGVTGPEDWEKSAAYIETYCAIAGSFDFPVSLFLHPEVAAHHSSLLEGLERTGTNISGLHLHPWKYDPENSLTHVGHMEYDLQMKIIARAMTEWTQGLGRQPQYFRPGTFSANDFTAPIMRALGFIGGSISVPGRIFPDLGAVWEGCPPDPHLLHNAQRVYPGSLPLPNMPLTVDFSKTLRRNGRQWHPDFRPDQIYEDMDGSIRAVLGQIRDRNPTVPVFNTITHNDNDYTDPANPVRRNLEAVLGTVKRLAPEYGFVASGGTIKDVCDRVLDLNIPSPAFVRV